MNRSRLILVAVCAILALVVVAAAVRISTGARGGGSGLSQGVALVGGPFKLVDQDGKPADESILKGKWTAVFFGYTYCPDICPTTLQTLGVAQTQLGSHAKDFQTVFITVDPARDTPSQLKTYLSSPVFPRGMIGLTGSDAQVAAAAKAYRAPYSKEGEGEGYLMNHPAMLYLMDPQGRFSRIVPNGLSPDETARQITAAMRGGA